MKKNEWTFTDAGLLGSENKRRSPSWSGSLPMLLSGGVSVRWALEPSEHSRSIVGAVRCPQSV
eukprot:2997566-Prymnesium_polylepis.1